MNARLKKFMQMVAVGLIGAVMIFVGGAIAQPFPDGLTIAGYELLSSKRVGRTTFEYEYSVNVQNATSSDVESVSVSVSSSSASVTVVDGTAEVGSIASGTTATSGDTIAVQVDRRSGFSPQDLDTSVYYESDLKKIQDPAGRITMDIPSSWIPANGADQSLDIYFSFGRLESDIPPNFYAITYDLPSDISSLPFLEAHRRALFLSGVSLSDIDSEVFVNGGLEFQASVFGGYRFVLLNGSRSIAVVFVSGDESVFVSSEFIDLLNSVEFFN